MPSIPSYSPRFPPFAAGEVYARNHHYMTSAGAWERDTARLFGHAGYDFVSAAPGPVL